jgi:biopolymer transport protein ExbB
MSAMGSFKGDEDVKFAMVSGPISQALIVTAAGILVAVESVILFNYFSQRAGRIATEMKMLTDEFLELLLEPGDEPVRTKKADKPDPSDKPDGKQKDDDGGGRAAA